MNKHFLEPSLFVTFSVKTIFFIGVTISFSHENCTSKRRIFSKHFKIYSWKWVKDPKKLTKMWLFFSFGKCTFLMMENQDLFLLTFLNPFPIYSTWVLFKIYSRIEYWLKDQICQNWYSLRLILWHPLVWHDV